jgi:predicted transcriptional regulator
MKKGKYGYIEFVDKRKLKHDGWDDQIEPEIRKPTQAEREEIILNIIRDNSGKAIQVHKIAALLAVSDRTIQKVLRKLEENCLIKRTSRYDKNKRQRANILEYIGPDKPRSESDLTLAKLYDPDNPNGIRDWDWEEYKFIPGYYTTDFTKKDAMHQNESLKAKKKILADKKAKLKKD